MTAVYFNNCKKHLYTLLSNITEWLNVETAAAAATAVLWSMKTTCTKL